MVRRPTLRMSVLLERLARNQKGVTGVEYTMIAATVSVAAIVGMNAVGDALLGAISNLLS